MVQIYSFRIEKRDMCESHILSVHNLNTNVNHSMNLMAYKLLSPEERS